ncbi:hypothetical protein CSB11_02650 [Candidatus Campbellbacteria bacterium]|nr:MAG: hypothetical protein CSB11_02650 [Candidatus Campbellbacteria bacterium]
MESKNIDTTKILKQILEIKPENKFLKYIVNRIQKDDYRGTHISQHNRYTMEYMEQVFNTIFKIAGTNKFAIPTGDHKINFNDIDLETKFSTYKKIVDSLYEETGKGTYNSVKKNFSVDWDKMSFLNRYDKDGKKRNSFKGVGVHYIQLTETAVSLIKETNILKKYKIFTDAVERLFGNKLSEIVETIYYSDYRNTTISIYEFVFILLDSSLGREEKIELMQSYRELPKIGRNKFFDKMKEYAKPSNFDGNKTKKRDFHNWKNESQQILSLLKTTVYFDVVLNRFLKLNVGNTGIFSEDMLQKRSESVKIDYFKEHGINKKSNFELHHIIPFRHARNKNELKLIDNYKNLIYLHKSKHKEITKNKDRHVVLFIDPEKLQLSDFEKNTIEAINNDNTEYSKNDSILKAMMKHNKSLLESIFEYKQ